MGEFSVLYLLSLVNLQNKSFFFNFPPGGKSSQSLGSVIDMSGGNGGMVHLDHNLEVLVKGNVTQKGDLIVSQTLIA